MARQVALAAEAKAVIDDKVGERTPATPGPKAHHRGGGGIFSW